MANYFIFSSKLGGKMCLKWSKERQQTTYFSSWLQIQKIILVLFGIVNKPPGWRFKLFIDDIVKLPVDKGIKLNVTCVPE